MSDATRVPLFSGGVFASFRSSAKSPSQKKTSSEAELDPGARAHGAHGAWMGRDPVTSIFTATSGSSAGACQMAWRAERISPSVINYVTEYARQITVTAPALAERVQWWLDFKKLTA